MCQNYAVGLPRGYLCMCFVRILRHSEAVYGDQLVGRWSTWPMGGTRTDASVRRWCMPVPDLTVRSTVHARAGPHSPEHTRTDASVRCGTCPCRTSQSEALPHGRVRAVRDMSVSVPTVPSQSHTRTDACGPVSALRWAGSTPTRTDARGWGVAVRLGLKSCGTGHR